MQLIQELFHNMVKKTPEAIAVLFQDTSYTYDNLNRRANGVAAYLLNLNLISRNEVIGVMFERSYEMIYSIYGIEKAGCGYLPINPEDPVDRIQYILQDSRIKIVITQSKHLESLKRYKGKIICIDKENIEECEKNPAITYHPDDIAYVIYTSGTTGNPKGVVIRQESLRNRILWMNKCYPITKHDVILQKTPYTFDVSVWEIFWWGIAGASVSVLEPGGHKNVLAMIQNIENNRVTVMHFVPSMLNLFLEFLYQHKGEMQRKISTLSYVFSSGEELLTHHVNDFKLLVTKPNNTRLINLYGPTEATIDVTYFECTYIDKMERIPIGKEIDQTEIYILKENNELCINGEEGELCIAGVGLAKGYINNDTLTQEKFTYLKIGNETKRIYHTGDLAVRQEDGNLIYKGRMDTMVKIRGNRVELGEVEAIIRRNLQIQDAVAVVVDQQQKDPCLCAFVVPYTKYINLDVNSILEKLKKQLPDYMLPKKIILVQEIPLNMHGKVDKEQLLTLIDKYAGEDGRNTKDADEDYNMILSILESKVNLLKKTEQIKFDDSLEELGVDSLSFLRIIIAIEQTFQIQFDLDSLDIANFTHLIDLYNYVKKEKEK